MRLKQLSVIQPRVKSLRDDEVLPFERDGNGSARIRGHRSADRGGAWYLIYIQIFKSKIFEDNFLKNITKGIFLQKVKIELNLKNIIYNQKYLLKNTVNYFQFFNFFSKTL